jgi:hypothetical protein
MKNLNGNINDTAERDLLINKIVLISLHTPKPIDVFVNLVPHIDSLEVRINVGAEYVENGKHNTVYQSNTYINKDESNADLLKVLSECRSVIKSNANMDVPPSIKQIEGAA